MDYNFRLLDSYGHYNRESFPTSSFPVTIDGRSVGPADMREAVLRELEKERIRNEILAEEIERRRILVAEVRRELMIEFEMTAAPRIGAISSPLMLGQTLRAHRYQFEPEMVPVGELFSPEFRIPMPEGYGGGGGKRCDAVAVEAVPIRRRTQSECIGLGKCSGSKRKAPEPLTKEDYICTVCNVSATSERDLQDHLYGKKHQAKVGATKAGDKKVMARRKKGKKIKRAGKKGKKHWKPS